MPTQPSQNLVAQSADAFEAALKESRIPEQLHDGLWDVWVNNPARAGGLVARFKDGGHTPAVAFKASGDAVEQRGARLVAALRARYGDTHVLALLDQIERQYVGTAAAQEIVSSEDGTARRPGVTTKSRAPRPGLLGIVFDERNER